MVFPTIVFIVLMTIVLLMSKNSMERHKELLKKEIEVNGRLRFKEFLTYGRNSKMALENLKKRIEMTDGGYFNYWEADAERILKQDPAFRFIQWVDTSMVIEKVMPINGNESAIDMDISYLERRTEWMRHVKDSSTNITSWKSLRQGGLCFLMDVPVFFKGRFQGTITAGLDFTAPFNNLASAMTDYSIELKDDKGTSFYTYNEPNFAGLSKGLIYMDTYEVDRLDGQNWTFYLAPKNLDVWQDRVKGVYDDLVFGILLSLLTSSLIYFYIFSRNENRRFRELNLKLSDTNASLRKEQMRAEKASMAKTEFVSNMSHEIRTPLNAIMGFIQVLKESKLDQSLMECLSLMDLSSKKLLLLINDVLEIDKIESGQVDFRKDIFSPSSEMDSIISIYKPSMKAKGLYVKLESNVREGRYVVGDMGKYGQILTNLLRNALKFTKYGGVEVNYREEEVDQFLDLQISIKDSGIGIPNVKLKSIFDRFIQIDSGMQKKHEGSGLGLYITYLLIELMQGHIDVNSVENEGSEFIISLKFPLAETSAEKDSTPDLRNIDLGDRKVLIVDDNRINMMVLKKALENYGVDSDWIANGQQAMEAIVVKDYDLVFMDIHMPEMDGFEATREIRETNTEIIIIGFSADVTKEAIQGAKDAGMNDYLTKPISFDKLRQSLLKYLVK